MEALLSQKPKFPSMFMKRHVLSMREFSREEIDSVLDLAASLEPYARGKKSDMMAGRILALLFFEPSTRTRMSFETAMKRLGGSVINLGPADGSSISKGESLADTVRVMGSYADALNIRHPNDGSARLAPKPFSKSFPSLPQQIRIYASSSRYS